MEEYELYKAAFDQLSEGVIIADADGHIVYVNRRAEEQHGVKKLDVSPDEYVDTYHLYTMDGQPYPVEALPMTRTVSSGEIVEDAYWRIKRPDGSEIIALGTSKPVLNQAGKQIASVLTISDDTDAYERERALEQSLHHTQSLLFEINHRVKNNLQIIASLVSMQQNKVVDEHARRAFDDLANRVRVVATVNNYLFDSSGTKALDVVDYLKTFSKEGLSQLAGVSDVKLATTVKGQAIMPVERAISLALAINELVMNSVKHAFDDTKTPKISLDIQQSGNILSIRYTDNGCGLDEAASAPTRKGFGTLMISGLALQLDAKLTYDEAPEGFAMTITIPLDSPKLQIRQDMRH